MYFYRHSGSIFVSTVKYACLNEVSEDEAAESNNIVYFLRKAAPRICRRSFCVSQPDLAFIESEGIELLLPPASDSVELPEWLLKSIANRTAASINTAYPNWKAAVSYTLPKKWRVNVIGLGDVGGTLVAGLRLLGGSCISQIGIYDIDPARVKRWEYEANQIFDSSGSLLHPEVTAINSEQLFDCDMFVFCVTAGVPPIGDNTNDIRIAQLKGNSPIIRDYACRARSYGYKGIFSVVSDPVDILCKAALDSSNINSKGEYDFMGLAPEQIRGYGLGVMYARAAYSASLEQKSPRFIKEGRAYGVHGEGLVIANSISNYNDELSLLLTERAKSANKEIRSLGYKPYIAPALSSACLSMLATIRGEWHYSATYLGGVYLGARNRLLPTGIELERQELPEKLYSRIKNTYESLSAVL